MSVWLIDVVGCIVLVNTIYAADNYTRCYEEYCFTVESPQNAGLNSVTRNDAEADCHSYNATLLTITSATAQANFEQFINEGMHTNSISSQLTVAWIKATRTPTFPEWIWLTGVQYNFKDTEGITDQVGTQSIATSYAYLKNDPSQNNYIYHAADPKNYWTTYVCEIYNVSDGTCTSAFSGHVLNGRCYWVGNNLAYGTWFNARNQCLLKGGDLASFDNMNSSSMRSLLWLTSANYWIGLYRNKWTIGGGIGSEIKYTNWAEHYPNNFDSDCICINQPSWTWTQCGCGDGHSVICSNKTVSNTPSSSSPTTTIITTTTTATTTTTTSPPPTLSMSTKSASADLENKQDNLALPIGVGVGVGGGVLLIIIIIVIVVCLRKRKSNDAEKPTELVEDKSDSKKKKEKKETKNNGNAIYATVSMKRDSTSPIVENEDPTTTTNNSSLEYATLDFVNKQQD